MTAPAAWFILVPTQQGFFGNLGVYRFRRGTERSRGSVSSFHS